MKPLDVLGVKVKPETVDRLVIEQLSSGSLWRERDDYDNASGLQRAIRAVDGSDLQSLFINSVLKRAADRDKDVRREALKTIRSFAGRANAEDLARMLRQRPQDYRGPVDLPEGDLHWLMISAIAAAVRPGDGLAIEVLKEAVRDPEMGGTAVAGLVDADPSWMVTYPLEWLDGDGERLRTLLFRIKDDESIERAVRATAAGSPDLRAGAVRAIREQVADRDQAAHLISLLG